MGLNSHLYANYYVPFDVDVHSSAHLLYTLRILWCISSTIHFTLITTNKLQIHYVHVQRCTSLFGSHRSSFRLWTKIFTTACRPSRAPRTAEPHACSSRASRFAEPHARPSCASRTAEPRARLTRASRATEPHAVLSCASRTAELRARPIRASRTATPPRYCRRRPPPRLC